MAGTASELIRGAAVRRLELPNRAMAASGQAKRHQSNSDQRAHWGRHGDSLPHAVHGSPQLEARPGVSCNLLDRAVFRFWQHRSRRRSKRATAGVRRLVGGSKAGWSGRHEARSHVSHQAAGSSAPACCWRASMPVSSSARPALPPQPSWRMWVRRSRSVMARWSRGCAPR